MAFPAAAFCRGTGITRADDEPMAPVIACGGFAANREMHLAKFALDQNGAVVDSALERTRTSADRADMIGCSLGGTIMFIHAVLERRNRLGALVAMGTPVRWVSIHPLLRAAFSSPALVGAIRLRGTRQLAEVLLPQLVRFTPWLLSIYMNPEITDVSAAREMVKTVEDPNRAINRQIADWIVEVVDGLAARHGHPDDPVPTVEDLRRWVAAGHALGNHTWDHPSFTGASSRTTAIGPAERPVPREVLAGLLWPELDEERARMAEFLGL